MDAYVFASSATPAAVDALKGSASPSGPVRVVCPLTGDRGLYVALAAADRQTLQDGIDDVVAMDGLTGTSAHVAVADVGIESIYGSSTFPTHVAVSAHVGFALVVDVTPALAAPAAPDIIGIAALEDGGLLVEVTADTAEDVRDMLDRLDTVTGRSDAVTAYGATADGAGFETA